MVNSKVGRYIVSITAIGIISLVVLSFIPRHHTGDDYGSSGGGGSTTTIPDPKPQEKPAAKTPAKKSAPKKETPSTPAPLPNNNQPTPTQSTPPPVINITVPDPIVIDHSALEPQSSPMANSAPTYTIAKDGADVLENALLGDVRKFVYDLNNYVNWHKAAESGSLEDLTSMLSANGYSLSKNN
jgi:hypothetical protein